MTPNQADRDAAADFLEGWEPGPEMTVVKLARAFAAHRRAALEEAAKLAEEYNRWSYVQFSDGEWQPGSPYDRGQQNAAQAITTDIRALIDKEPT